MENLSIFKNIEPEDINKMLKCFEARTSKFKKGSTILSFIGNNSMVGIVLEGEAALIRYDYSGNKTLIEQLGPNSMFGERFSNYNADELLVEATKDSTILFMDYTLRKHIVETDKKDKKRFDILMKQMLEKNPIDENLKNTDPLKWVGLMNNYKHCVEEIILKEFIYV